MTALEHDRYPIGRFARCAGPLDRAERSALIDAIARAPSDIRRLVEHLTEAQLETRYRVDGWTIRQVVHHVHICTTQCRLTKTLGISQNYPLFVEAFSVLPVTAGDLRRGPTTQCLSELSIES